MIPHVSIHLLDAAQGHPLQSWTFENRELITFGRAEDNDVVVADPYVSRSHARLCCEGGAFKLISISKQQITYEGQSWPELTLRQGMVFRLGPHGCFLRFGDVPAGASNLSTMSYDPTLMPVLTLDREQLSRAVNEIVEGDYFQQLQSAARKLRKSSADTRH